MKSHLRPVVKFGGREKRPYKKRNGLNLFISKYCIKTCRYG